MRQPYYLGIKEHEGKVVYYIYNDYGNRASRNMPRPFAIRLLDFLNAKGYKAMEKRDFDPNGNAIRFWL